MTQGTDSVSETRYRTNRFVTNIRVEAEGYAQRRGFPFMNSNKPPMLGSCIRQNFGPGGTTW